MSARRAARATTATVGALVPDELLDPHAQPWQSAEATVEWCDEHAVPPPGALDSATTPAGRLRALIPAYAVATDHVSPRWPKIPDHRWLRDVGLAAVHARCTRLVLPVQPPT